MFVTALSTDLHLAFLSPAANPFLQVAAYNASGTALSYVSATNYVAGGAISANTWYAIDIPLGDLNIAASSTAGFAIEKNSTGTIWFDDIRLTNESTSTSLRNVLDSEFIPRQF